LQRLSNKKKKIERKRKGLLLRLNMIGGYSRKLLGMRVLPLHQGGSLEVEVEGVGREKSRRGERRSQLWLGIRLVLGLMMSPSQLGMVTDRDRDLEEEVVEEAEDVVVHLELEVGLTVMAMVTDLLTPLPLLAVGQVDKDLRIEHRRKIRYNGNVITNG
jgi:hypothetical protein